AMSAGPTAGALLRAAREAAGIHIAALAALLKVPETKLQALEHDRLDLLLDAVFARALASSVCRTLKIDARPVLERLPPTSACQLKRSGGEINAPFRSSVAGPVLSARSRISRPVVLAGIALLLGAMVLIVLPTIEQYGEQEQRDPDGAPGSAGLVLLPLASARAGSGDDLPVPVAEIPGAGVADGPATVDAPLSGSSNSPALVSQDTLVAVQAPVPPSGNSAIPAAPAASTAGPVAQVASPGNVSFRASGQSWVKVTDANGMVVLTRTLASGEAAEASGALPLSVVVGRSDLTQVQVRGKAFDLSAVSRDNVARFEVK
ncbi:RodZ domain-containing protein, partial [Polaromonas sp.]|uniref:RodZ domain-containing protein n=1 Tax=Polaromonas sp. TaxID=1869339 RepID=UPI003454178F